MSIEESAKQVVDTMLTLIANKQQQITTDNNTPPPAPVSADTQTQHADHNLTSASPQVDSGEPARVHVPGRSSFERIQIKRELSEKHSPKACEQLKHNGLDIDTNHLGSIGQYRKELYKIANKSGQVLKQEASMRSTTTASTDIGPGNAQVDDQVS